MSLTPDPNADSWQEKTALQSKKKKAKLEMRT